MSHPASPHFIGPEDVLHWAPSAPALSFSHTEEGWRLGPEFQIQHLRATTAAQVPVAIRRDSDQRLYYLPHWAAFTAWADAQTPSQRKQAARRLAAEQHDGAVYQTAPELGFPYPPAWALLVGKRSPEAPAGADEESWLAYWKRLKPFQREQAAQPPEGLPSCLELALDQGRWAAAEALWEAGHRPTPKAQERGALLWPWAGQGSESGWEAFRMYWRDLSLPLRALLWAIGEREWEEHGLPEPLDTETPASFLKRESDVGLSGDVEHVAARAFVLLSQRWLRRAVETQANANATVRVVWREDPEQTAAVRTPFNQMLLASLPLFRSDAAALALVWVRAMAQASYAWGAPIVEHTRTMPEGASGAVGFAEACGMPARALFELRALALEAALPMSPARARTRM